MKILVATLLILSSVSCTKIYNNRERSTTLVGPSTTTEAKADIIEFRVFGNVSTPVVIRHSNSLDGLSVNASAGLPYYASIQSTQESIFLFIEAGFPATSTPAPTVIPAPSIQVQIFVNGKVFREAYSTLLAQASGTFRR